MPSRPVFPILATLLSLGMALYGPPAYAQGAGAVDGPRPAAPTELLTRPAGEWAARLGALQGRTGLIMGIDPSQEFSVPARAIDDAAALTAALFSYELYVLHIDTAQAGAPLLIAAPVNELRRIASHFGPLTLDAKQPLPNRPVLVRRALSVHANADRAWELVAALEHAQTEDPLGLGRCHFLPDLDIIVVTDLASRIQRHQELAEVLVGERLPAATDDMQAPAAPRPSPKRVTGPTTIVRSAKSVLGKEPAPSKSPQSATVAALQHAHRLQNRAKIREEEKALIAKGAGTVPELEDALSRERHSAVKGSLKYVLLSLKGGANVENVLDLLEATTNSQERLYLCQTLFKIDAGPEDTERLNRYLRESPDPNIRRYLIRALAETDQALTALGELARHEKDRVLRQESLYALERLIDAHPNEVADLMAELSAERDMQVRQVAVRALAKCGGPSHAEAFRNILRGDEQVNQKMEAARYFERMGTEADLELLRAQLEQPELPEYARRRLASAVREIELRAGAK
ncbi:MAG: HEAT repeat domain-containing protein [Planctomycetota bacterium]